MTESTKSVNNARAFPESDPCQQPPVGVRDRQGVPRRAPCPRLKKQMVVRVGTWNVGTMIGKGRELVDVFKRSKINIACVEETKWSGNSTRELGEGYKIFFSGKTDTRNGVGIILDEKLKQQVFEVQGASDRLIRVRLVTADHVYNVILGYATVRQKQ